MKINNYEKLLINLSFTWKECDSKTGRKKKFSTSKKTTSEILDICFQGTQCSQSDFSMFLKKKLAFS